MTLASRWRWVPAAQLLQVELEVPRALHVPLYSTWSFVERRESWWIPGAAAFNLHARQVGIRTALPVWLPRVVLTADVSARMRRFANAAPPPEESGNLPPLPAVDQQTTGIVWFRLTPRLALPAHRIGADWELRGQARAGIEAARTKGPHTDTVSRVWGSGGFRADRTRSGGRTVTLDVGLHAGWLSHRGLAEDHFTLGVGPDAEFPLRGHPVLRDRMPGQAPLAGSFMLAGFMASGDVKTSRWMKVGMFGFVDAARVMRPYPAASGADSFVDTGVGIDFGPPLLSSSKLSVVWAFNGQTRHGAFYFSAKVR